MTSDFFSKIFYLHLLMFLAGTNGFAETTNESASLTLNQAKKIAVDRNAGLLASKALIEASRARQGRATSGYYPTLESKLGSEQGLSGDAKKNASFGYLLARWNLYRGGRDAAATKIADLESKLTEIEFDQQRLAIENEIENVFSNLLFIRDVRRIKERFIQLNTSQQAMAKQVVSRGGASESDVVEFDLREATLRSELTQIDQDYHGFLVRLKSLIGEDIAKNPTPTGELPHQHLQDSLSDYANANLVDSPQIKGASVSLDLASSRANAVTGRWLPQFDIEGRFGILPLSDGGDANKVGSSVALVATWEIFGGFDTVYESKEKKALKSSADWQLQSDINSILAEVEARFGELVSIQKRAELEKDNIVTATKYHNLVLSDYKRGYKNSGDLSAAAQTWYEAEVQRKRLDLGFIEKKLALELKLGRRIATIPMKSVSSDTKGPTDDK